MGVAIKFPRWRVEDGTVVHASSQVPARAAAASPPLLQAAKPERAVAL